MDKNYFHEKDVADDRCFRKKYRFERILGPLVAAALGAAIGVFFAPKSGEETQKELLEKAQHLARNFSKSREEIQETIQNIFGKVSEELEKNYLELQGNILAQLEDIKDKAEFTQQKYDEIVYEVVHEFSKEKKWPEKIIYNLTRTLQNDWEKLEQSFKKYL